MSKGLIQGIFGPQSKREGKEGTGNRDGKSPKTSPEKAKDEARS